MCVCVRVRVRPVEKRLREAVQFGVEGSNVFLECQPRSPQASVKWLLQKDGRRKLVSGAGGTAARRHTALKASSPVHYQRGHLRLLPKEAFTLLPSVHSRCMSLKVPHYTTRCDRD